MCLTAFAIGQSAELPFVLLANRDEHFDRPAAPMSWWPAEVGKSQLLAGRDLSAGGVTFCCAAAHSASSKVPSEGPRHGLQALLLARRGEVEHAVGYKIKLKPTAVPGTRIAHDTPTRTCRPNRARHLG